MRRLVDDAQQALVDRVAVGQQLVEVHRAHHRADVGHGQVEDGVLQVGDLIGRLRRVEHLVEGDAVDGDRSRCPGDDLLRRHVEHLLHHVHLGADAVDERDDQVEAGRQRAGVAAEALDRVVVALRHGLDAREDEQQDENDEHRYDDVEAREHAASPRRLERRRPLDESLRHIQRSRYNPDCGGLVEPRQRFVNGIANALKAKRSASLSLAPVDRRRDDLRRDLRIGDAVAAIAHAPHGHARMARHARRCRAGRSSSCRRSRPRRIPARCRAGERAS